MNTKVLVVDDEFLIRMSLESGLSDLGHQVKTAETFSEGLALAESWRPDVVLLDNKLGGELGLEHIEDFKKLDEDIQIIMITAYGSVSQAVEAMKRGACHYIQKPFDLEEVDLIIRRNLDQLKRRRSLELMRQRPRQIVGESEAIQRICRNVAILAENDNVDLLICGETGTGKGVVVNAIHDSSPRRDIPLVKINCGAIPESLLESELFGYEKGAFTGALNQGKAGLFELANSGTILLDEIGDLPYELQTKLLRVLQQKEVMRLGGTKPISLDVRVIAATNADLKKKMQEGSFREDLYYRLSTIPIYVPPLRERPEDILKLVKHYFFEYCTKHAPTITVPDETLAVFQSYCWPGNVRELQNVIEYMVICCEGNVLQPSVLADYLGMDSQSIALHPASLKAALDDYERSLIARALEEHGGVRKAAHALGVDPSTISRKAKKYGLEVGEGIG